ncbi:tRNA 2-selenouridine(34) synthase MnmH [Marinospirillum sp.]|uniref:tRNA 2-selenouridine(34) synthase MnmH n=1 Tax=Marinospirillum sp. TaxID=2183934 RepID=UPI0028707A78|nr:tRNA 2-selenouridine(34) synthase MnmH [Marinospirillum sp.]MDR9469442.1 tRNA 2-selenouridine(34) synthase MnmH [Marinospirillum sp.]
MPELVDHYREILLSGAPLMDTRAPVEFDLGSFPTAENLPLMLDEERAAVGTCYKQKGQEAAIRLGHELVHGKIKEQRVAAWVDFAHRHPEGYLFCFRGGLRSQLVQQWMAEAGVEYPRIAGGYKALRRFLIDTTDQTMADCSLLLVSGMTGTGKTELLMRLNHAVDLEGHAQHRGSSFGRHAHPQPTPINFENALAIDLLHQRHAGHWQLVVEDENQTIGRLALPQSMIRKMEVSPLVVLDAPFAERVERILKDYVIDLRGEFLDQQGLEAGHAAFAQHLQAAMDRIRKRLGGERHQRLSRILQEALACGDFSASLDQHRQWITTLLEEYYDPMYHHHEKQKQGRIVFRGEAQAVEDFIRQQYPG